MPKMSWLPPRLIPIAQLCWEGDVDEGLSEQVQEGRRKGFLTGSTFSNGPAAHCRAWEEVVNGYLVHSGEAGGSPRYIQVPR